MNKRLYVLVSAAFLSIAQASELPGYDFHYHAAGDNVAKPLQIFDDGTHLYLQFKDADMIPALFVNSETGAIRLPVHQSFPYLVIDKLSPEILVKLGGHQAVIYYDGGRSLTDSGTMTGSAQSLNVAAASSIPTEHTSDPAMTIPHAAIPTSFSGELIFNQSRLPHSENDQPVAAINSYPQTRPAVAVATSDVSASVVVHRVREGESLSFIAHQHHVSIRQLSLLNKLRNADFIFVGQNLLLPAYGHDEIQIKETTTVTEDRKQPVFDKKITAAFSRNWHGHIAHTTFPEQRTQFRLYEKTASGKLVIKEIRSLREIGKMAELSHAIYLRGEASDTDLRRKALTRYGIDPAKIHVISRSHATGFDDGIVDIVFSSKD